MAPPPVQLICDQLEVPEKDDRSYRVIKLANQLEALLVHDPETDKASASVCVDVGNFSDDGNMPGMAHAVEHLLFMGTKKFPQENEYNRYLAAHSGHSNAYTASTHTNYYFEVASTAHDDKSASSASPSPSPLYGALDRFAQFFISPLFLASTLDRELRAVDSENKKNLQNDSWRLRQLDKTLASPLHPYHHFSTGSLATLKDDPRGNGVDIRQAFIDFHDKHYSANRTKLVLLGKESLDELQEWVVDLFNGVHNKELPQNRWDNHQPYTSEQLETIIYAKPVMDFRQLEFHFPFPSEEEMFEIQPSRYISHLIGHEGPGSILAVIKEKGLANNLSAGLQPVCSGSAFFDINIRLTEEGLRRYEEVVQTVFQYIALLRSQTPQKWIMEEIMQMGEVSFKYREKTPASFFASSMSSVMQKPLPRKWLLSGTELIRRFDADAISKALEYLRPDNFRLLLVSQKVPDVWDQRERWYGTEYKVEPFSSDFKRVLNEASLNPKTQPSSSLHLPHPNEFIPTKLDVEQKEIATPAKAPKLIRNDKLVRMWYKKDDTFWFPKAFIFLTLRNPLTAATPGCMVRSKLFCDLVKDSLVEYSYDAEISGLNYSLAPHYIGLSVDVDGYNDKLAVLLEKVLVSLRDLKVRPDRFDIIKERMMRTYRNRDFEQPYRQVSDYFHWLNTEQAWIVEQYIAALEPLTAKDVAEFYPQLLQQMQIEAFCYGNVYKEDALKLADLIESTFKPQPLPPSQWLVKRNMLFPSGSDFTYRQILKDPANVNNCIEYYVPVGLASDRQQKARLLLLGQLTEEAGFDQLRTKEQLGYIVWTTAKVNSTTMGYAVIIQSERSNVYLEERINAFLHMFGQRLEAMTDAEFASHKKSLIHKRLEKMKNLYQEAWRIWGYITNEYYDYWQRDKEVELVTGLSKADMIAFFNKFIHPTSTKRAKISVHVNAQSSPDRGITTKPLVNGNADVDLPAAPAVKQTTYIDDVRDFKSTLAVSAGPRPVTDLNEFEEAESKL